jgi:hypothetical protein
MEVLLVPVRIGFVSILRTRPPTRWSSKTNVYRNNETDEIAFRGVVLVALQSLNGCAAYNRTYIERKQ